MSWYSLFEIIILSSSGCFTVFRALPLTGSDLNPYQATISTFVKTFKRILSRYLVWVDRDWAPRFVWMKKLLNEIFQIHFFHLILENNFFYWTFFPSKGWWNNLKIRQFPVSIIKVVIFLTKWPEFCSYLTKWPL